VCRVGHARAFAPKQDQVVRGKSEFGIGDGAVCGEQDQPTSALRPPGGEILPRSVSREADEREVVHAGAPERPVREIEPCRLDDVRLDVEQAHSRRIVPAFCGMSGW
jgi:hypothetical protein